MKKIIFYILLVISINSYSQSFFVNTVDNTQLINNVYQFDISNSTEIIETICPPTNNIGQYFENTYTDIAIDKDNNMYYVSGWGSLYKKIINDSTCHYMGKFAPIIGTINSLVADSSDFLYASGNLNGVAVLYKFDIISGVFYEIGNLPVNYLASGDLFFYNNSLFLTCINTANSNSNPCIIEVNMINPSKSCFYMNISNEAIGAFSIDYGSHSKAYIITSNLTNSSSIYEVDMVNKQVGNLITSYNYIIYGAASKYALTSTNSICENLSTDVNIINKSYLHINNPARNSIKINTNIEKCDISSIHLFDITGKFIKSFNNDIRNLDISNISNGIYMLILNTKNGNKYSQKVIIEN